MQELIALITKHRDAFLKATFSSPREGAEFTRIGLRAADIGRARWQAEQFSGAKVFHRNLTDTELPGYVQEQAARFGQIVVMLAGRTVTFTAKGKQFRRSEQKNTLTERAVRGNDRKKRYLLQEGEAIPALVDLGVFTPEYQVKAAMYDKYKQINRFVECIDDALRGTDKTQLTLVDFGCGKSYLTFIVYYYLVVKRGIRARIVGYDLKEDVVCRCNAVARKYGYDGLEFFVNDVTRGTPLSGGVDAVMTLHACDIATDYALAFAVERGADYIFSVPCCQHEINGSIRPGGDFDLLLRDGLIKDRFCALLTDSVRAELLRSRGYAVDVLEFVDFAHSPKNVMLRARRTRPQACPDDSRVEALMRRYGFTQTLYGLLHGDAH